MPRKQSPVASRDNLFRKSSQNAPDVSEQSDTPKIKREKRTYHLPEDVVLLLSELQLSEYRRTGRKPELSDLVSEAIQLLGESRKQDGETLQQRAS